MGLFGTQKVSKGLADEAVTMVETYFQQRNLDVHDHQLTGSDGFGWWLTEGSAKIYIFVQDGSNGAVLRITSPLVYVPEHNKETFFHRLLDINTNLTSCALATHGDIVLVVCQRPTLGLVQEELDELVWNIAYVADLLDNKLAEEFKTRMYSEDAEANPKASRTR